MALCIVSVDDACTREYARMNMTGQPDRSTEQHVKQEPKLQEVIGARIRERRIELGLSQRELARRANVDTGLLWRYEDGRTLARLDLLEPIAVVLGIRLDWLVTGREPRLVPESDR